MAGEWTTKTIAEITSRVAMGPFGSNIKKDNFVEFGVPVIRGNNLTKGRFNNNDFAYLTEEKADQLLNSNAYPGDLVFTHRGTLGQVGIIPSKPFKRYVVSQSQMVLTVDPLKSSSLFLFYFFKSALGQHSLLKHTSQTGVPAISRPVTSLKSIDVPLPPLEEQQAIACILGALDDRIELNRRMNQTLEDMARAIFKSWCVNFDPVRAKSEGRKPPGLTSEIAALFPDSFEDSELGEIPKDWNAGKLGDIAKEVRNSIGPAEIDPGTLYIALEHMPKRCMALDDWGIADDVASGKLQFRCDDILFGKLRPYFHKVGPAPIDGVCSTDIVVARPVNNIWFGLVIGYMTADAFVAQTDSSSTGTKMPRTNWRDMAAYPIVIPPSDVAKRHTDIVRPIVKKMQNLVMHSRSLGDLRDVLLPTLISGDLRVQDAERIVGRCV